MRKMKKHVAVCLAALTMVSLMPTVNTAKAAQMDEVATVSDAAEYEEPAADTEEAEALEEDAEVILEAVPETISVSVHQQGYGSEAAVNSGEVAGNVATGKRLEGFIINRTTGDQKLAGSIVYRANCQSIGWQEWKNEGELAGTTGRAKRLEAIQIQLTGELAENYDIYYRVYMTNAGWLGWTKNGEIAGTIGLACALDGMQVAIVPKTDTTSIRTERYACLTSDTINDVIYSGHVQTYGDRASVQNGATFGTVGEAKRLEALQIRLSHGSNQMYGTVKYQVHCQTYGWMDEVSEGKTAGTKAEAKRLEAINIKLSGDIAQYCDIYYRVHCQKHGWLGWAKNGGNAGTSGNGYRMEAIEIRIVPKGSAAPGSTDNAFSTKQIIETTSGYKMLEPYLDSIIAQCTTPEMTREQKLRACYDWVRDHYVYKSIGAEYPSNFLWHEYYAYQLVTIGYGNCYRFNSLFGHLAKRIGYTDVVFYKGYSSGEPHGWVTIDGRLYDPRYAHKYGGNFFGSTGGRVYTPYLSSR